VPTYEYQCDGCGRVFEVRQRISEAPLAACDECGGPVRRLLSPASFILKGRGWYVTDYPSESRKQALKAESGQSTSTSTDGKPASGGKSSTPPASTPASSAGSAGAQGGSSSPSGTSKAAGQGGASA
jgi:putative FmdB family regulatory protein